MQSGHDDDRYMSILIRCWRRPGGTHHIQLEHIQTGRRVQVATVEAALAWLADRWSPTPTDSPDGEATTR